MVNYYKVLKVSPQASAREIKTAYRRLAREHHPDVNGNTEAATRKFSLLAKAYEILSNPQERAFYDREYRKYHSASPDDTDSVFHTENLHARRLRKMAMERHYDQIVDRLIAEERQQATALQKVIFPTVALFVSTCFVGIFKPSFWTNSAGIGKIILITLFSVGVLHLFKRLRAGFELYTYDAENIHDSILDDAEPVSKPYSRTTAFAFLVIGVGLSLGVGLLIGNYLEMFVAAAMPKLFSPTLRLEFIFYPPIVVLLVDVMHTLAMKFDY